MLLKSILVSFVCLTLAFRATAQDYDTCSNDEHLMDPPECPPFEERPTYFPYPYDCTKFFECTNGDARCIQCPAKTRWDQRLEICNHEAAVDCVIVTTSQPSTTTVSTTTPTTTTPTTTTPTTTTPTTTTPTTTTPTTTTPTTTPTTTTPTTTPTTTSSSTTPRTTTTEDPAEWICEEGYQGPIGHPFDCRNFYICDPGRRPCLFTCPENLYWSPVTKDCEWPWDVPSCQGGTPPPPRNAGSRLVNYRNSQRSLNSDFVSSLMKMKSEGEDPCKLQQARF